HAGRLPEDPIDAHSVQPYYTLLMASEAKMAVSVKVNAESIVFAADPVPASA
ncbi:MAG TPA: histidine phosphotransferase family protein, partial [Rhizobiaceae bacterium]|nr:histidine phosphotransferase family protein [Rhizobiaceae bacterium]